MCIEDVLYVHRGWCCMCIEDVLYVHTYVYSWTVCTEFVL